MNVKDVIEKQFEQIIDQEKVSSLSAYASQLTNGISDQFTLEKILKATLEGQNIFSSSNIIDSFKQLILYELQGALVIGAEIVGICIIIGLLDHLSGSFESKNVHEIANLACCTIIIGLVMINFRDVYDMTLNAVETITYTMDIILPLLIGILAGMGQITSSSILNPLLLTMITAFQNIIKLIIIPAIFLAAIFTLLNCLTEKNYVNQLSKFLRQSALLLTGLIITLMSGIISIQGLITKTSDGLLMGAAKYAIDSFIPIVGGFTSDTVELFLSCMGSIKNIVGVFGIILIILFILTPISKTIAIALIYKITAFLIEPITNKKIAEGINEVGSTLIILSAVLFFSSLLFIIFITSIMKLGGTT